MMTGTNNSLNHVSFERMLVIEMVVPNRTMMIDSTIIIIIIVIILNIEHDVYKIKVFMKHHTTWYPVLRVVKNSLLIIYTGFKFFRYKECRVFSYGYHCLYVDRHLQILVSQ